MKTQFIFPLLLLFSSLLWTGCQKETPTQVVDNLNLRHQGADMPIWVRGNLASNKLILFLHGGPGDCAMCYRYYLEGLEERVAVAYWDQRIAGASSGKVDPATLNYPQFHEDMRLVIQLLKQQYPGVDIYLLGHSFGVDLGWQYLTTGDLQNEVKGFIAVNGTFSTYRWLHHMRNWVLREAEAQGDEEAAAYMLARELTPENVKDVELDKYFRYMLRLNGNPESVFDDKAYLVQYLFASPNLAFAQYTHGKQYEEYGRTEIFTHERGDLLDKVRIPIGLFWGVKDGVVPLEVGLETQEKLVNAPVTFVRFEEAWHEVFFSETEKFVREVLRFVEDN